MLLINLPLFVIIMLTFFSLVSNGGDLATISQGYSGSGFQLDASTGILSLIIVIIALVSILGIRVLGSGLSDSATRTITIGTGYGGIWALFSVFAMPLMLSITAFGVFIYVSLTILFTVGIFQKISGGDGSGD